MDDEKTSALEENEDSSFNQHQLESKENQNSTPANPIMSTPVLFTLVCWLIVFVLFVLAKIEGPESILGLAALPFMLIGIVSLPLTLIYLVKNRKPK